VRHKNTNFHAFWVTSENLGIGSPILEVCPFSGMAISNDANLFASFEMNLYMYVQPSP